MRSQYTNSFTSISNLPATALIASDKQNDNYFYSGYASAFYVSSDNGQTFAAGGSLSGASQINSVIAHPTTAGSVYVGTDGGIYQSTDFASSFTLLTSALTDVYGIALGVGSGSTWNLYAFGTGSAGNKLYGSADNGKTWTDLQGTQGFGSISSCKLAGSGNVAGQVYVGTNGRGVFYAKGTISGSTTGTSSASSSHATSSASSASSVRSSTSTIPTTLKTITSSSAQSTSTGTCSISAYGQCGGANYAGCTTCPSGYTCQAQNAYYSQCV
jgi:xyloglucan-specific exo-beta-1,4-glucanase